MLSDIKLADQAAESLFSDKVYLDDYEGNLLDPDEDHVWEYQHRYFAEQGALDFIEFIGAERMPAQADGLKVVDYSGKVLKADIDTYVYKGQAFQSDEVLELIQELGGHEYDQQ